MVVRLMVIESIAPKLVLVITARFGALNSLCRTCGGMSSKS